MKTYQTKSNKLSGTNFKEVHKKALNIYNSIKKRTKRRPYIKSAYFKKDKIFLSLYWRHLHEKLNHRDKTRRVKLFPCAIELVRHSKFEPSSHENPNKKSEILHRFSGNTAENDMFFVQIKEDKKTGQKWLMSSFPFYK